VFITHPRTLRPATFLARYDRFIARVRLGRREVDAHCVNPGRMEGLVRPGAKAWVSSVPPDSPRKLRYTLEMLEIDGIRTGVNTQMPNYLAHQLIAARVLPGLKRYAALAREVPYGRKSRIDFLLSSPSRPHYVEVKNCHLVYPDGGAYFPDSVSTRAAGHLEELEQCTREGARATVLFTVQRRDARFVRPSDLHDPAFAAAARHAAGAGVRFIGTVFEPREAGWEFLGSIPVRLGTYDATRLRPFRAALLNDSGWIRRKTGQRVANTQTSDSGN